MELFADTTQILVIDFQERLSAAMPEARREQCKKTVAVLGQMASILHLPVAVTEQYPKGLGPSEEYVTEAFPHAESQGRQFEKIIFSAWGCEAARKALESAGRRQVIVVGQETHVCVYQSVRDLLNRGFEPHVLMDGVMSRSEENRQIGLDLMAKNGAVMSSLETVMFDLLKQAGSDEFKALSKAIR